MTRHRLATGVRWNVGRSGLTLWAPGACSRELRYPEAAVWDLASREPAFPRLLAATSAIAALPAPEAEALVRRALAEWVAEGWLEAEAG